MKLIKRIGVVGVCCLALFLSGCGSESHVLKCEIKSVESTIKLNITFDSTKTKIENVKTKTIIDLGNYYTDEQVKQMRDFTEQGCKDSGGINCKVSLDGKTITSEYEAKGLDLINDEDISFEELKTKLEQDGYSCKK